LGKSSSISVFSGGSPFCIFSLLFGHLEHFSIPGTRTPPPPPDPFPFSFLVSPTRLMRGFFGTTFYMHQPTPVTNPQSLFLFFARFFRANIPACALNPLFGLLSLKDFFFYHKLPHSVFPAFRSAPPFPASHPPDERPHCSL